MNPDFMIGLAALRAPRRLAANPLNPEHFMLVSQACSFPNCFAADQPSDALSQLRCDIQSTNLECPVSQCGCGLG